MVDILPVLGPGHGFPAAEVAHLQGRDPGTGAPGPQGGTRDSLAALKLPWRRLGSWWSTAWSSSVMFTTWTFSLGLPVLSVV